MRPCHNFACVHCALPNDWLDYTGFRMRFESAETRLLHTWSRQFLKVRSKVKRGIWLYSLQGRLRWPSLALWVWRGIQGGKRHSRREIFQIFFWFFKIWKFHIFVFIPGSWGVHRYPWFQNWSINMARAEADKKVDILCALLYRCLFKG